VQTTKSNGEPQNRKLEKKGGGRRTNGGDGRKGEAVWKNGKKA